MVTKHPRTQARQRAGLTLQEAAEQIGLTPRAVEDFETIPTRTFKRIIHRQRARAIYGNLVGLPNRGCEQSALEKPCATCGKLITRAQRFGTKPHLPAIPGKRFCSYACRNAYGKPTVTKQKPTPDKPMPRAPSEETRAINELIALNRHQRDKTTNAEN